MSKLSIKQAVILAGGAGKRLQPFTLNAPKSLIPLHRRPFIDYLLKLVKDNGIEEVLMLIGYLGEKLQDYLGSGKRYGLKISYSYLPFYDKDGIEIESATRLKKAASLLNDHFLLMYCDNYWPLDLKKMWEHYQNKGTMGLVTVYNNKEGLAEYGFENNMLVDENDLVLDYDSSRKKANLNGTDIGFFLFHKTVIDFIPKGSAHLGKDVLPKLIATKNLTAYRTDHRYYFITSPQTLKKAKKFLKSKKIVFLDRDGVINKKVEGDYVRNWKQFKFLPQAVKGMQLLSSQGYQMYIITNQRGIARKLMKKKDLEVIHQKMLHELMKKNIKIKKIYYCPHEEGSCDCRKPKPGLLFKASNEHHIDLTKAIMIGDDERDIEAGKAAGCRTLLVDDEHDLLSTVKSIIRN